MGAEETELENEMWDFLYRAAELWARSRGDERFIDGASSTFLLRFVGAAEHVYMEVHKAFFPENHMGIDLYAEPRPYRQPLKNIELPENIPLDGVGCVYYHFGDDEALLYVGKTRHFKNRHQEHKKSAKWWNDVREIRVWTPPQYVDLEWLEVREIKRTRPKHNVRDNRP